jgi:signal transduction histidine kinase
LIALSIDDVPICIVVSRVDFQILQSNQLWDEHFGVSSKPDRADSFLDRFSKASQIFLQTHIFPMLLKNGAITEIFVMLRDKHDQETPVLLNAKIKLEDDEKHIIWSFFIERERRKLEEELIYRKSKSEEAALLLKKTSDELERSNKAMGEFASVVTHDLKAPLRHIMMVSEIFLSGEFGDLDEQSKQMLNLLSKGVVQAGQLVDDLHTYSMVGKNHGEFQELKLSEFLQSIFDLYPVTNEFILSAELGIEKINTLHVPLALILRNLVSNAIKYHNKPGGFVKVKCKELDEHYLFSVIDDGPGIAVENQEMAFRELKRLLTSEQNSGSGLGLSLVKKTLEIYGGDIELISSEGEGATFQFSWPKDDVLNRTINKSHS